MHPTFHDRSAREHFLREHIEALRELGELREVDQPVDWNLEIGAITRRICETSRLVFLGQLEQFFQRTRRVIH